MTTDARRAYEREYEKRDYVKVKRNIYQNGYFAQKRLDPLYRKWVSDYNKALRQRKPWLQMLGKAKSRARDFNVAYSLTNEWAEQRWTGKCEITGIDFVIGGTKGPKFYSPSLDRIVPSLGYVPENCRFILFGINAFKVTESDETMLMVAKAIVSALENKS